MKLNSKILLRVSIFGVLTVTVLLFLNSFFQPVWTKWNNYYTTKGFYEEPKNTIETVFLGASVTQSSISPMELYEEYGINSYNLGTEQQPMLGSYYWLRETYDYHSETLKTVVLDASALRSTSKKSFYHKCFDNMRLSKNKIQGVYEYVDGSIMDCISFITPLISYHNRWNSLDSTDFEKFGWDADTGTRGYYYIKNTYINTLGYDDVIVKNPVLDVNEVADPLLEDSLEYLDRIIKFCEEKGLKFVLIKTSASNWSSGLHNAVQAVADSYGVEFYDFNFDPLFDINGYIHAFDNSSDGHHLNYYGATKFTKWIGKFLVEECGATDIRNNPKYDFMKEQYEEYSIRVLQHVNLNSSNSFVDYLEHAVKGNTTVLISVQENAADALKENERTFLRELGLEKFAEIGRFDSYLAVIENGEVICEKIGKNGEREKTITYKNVLPDKKTKYRMESGGKNSGNIAEIYIDGVLESKSKRGTNIVVYSNDLEETLHSICFDTSVSTKKNRYGINDAFLLLDEEALKKDYDPTSIQGRILTYKQKVDNLREYENYKIEVGNNSLFSLFDKYFKDDVSVMISLYDNAHKNLTEKDRQNFRKYGLEKLAELKSGDSYVAYIENGEVVKEIISNEKSVAFNDISGIYLKSGSSSVGKTSSIKINGVEYSNKKRGLNVVFYDTKTDTVIASQTFDTQNKSITY